MKKRTLKKVLTLGMAALMTAGMLAGCGNDAGTKGDKENAGGKQTDESATKDKGDIPTLVWWTVGSTTPADYEESIAKINEYLVEKIGVKLDYKIAGWGDYEKKMNTIINSGEYFDIMFVNNTNYSKFVNLGAFENLTESLPTTAPELYDFIPESIWAGVQVNGGTYGVPTYKDSSMAQFWYIDDAYVQKYNIDMDSIDGTLESLDPIFRTIKEGEGKGFYPVQTSQGELWNGFYNEFDGLTAGLQPMGVRVDDETRQVVCTLEQEDVLKDLNTLHSWYVDGIINPDASVTTESTKNHMFGTAQGWPSAVATWQTLQGVEKYDAVKVFGPLLTTETIQGSINAISANSKHKEEAMKLLQLINTDPTFRDMMAYGVEGTHFEYVSDGVVKKLRDDWPGAGYTQGTFFIESILEGADPNQWEQVRKQNEEATPSTCLGFALDLTNIQTEMANCKTVWEKYRYEMMVGASDPETTVPKCVEELKAAGLDTIIAEAQKQIDEFFK